MNFSFKKRNIHSAWLLLFSSSCKELSLSLSLLVGSKWSFLRSSSFVRHWFDHLSACLLLSGWWESWSLMCGQMKWETKQKEEESRCLRQQQRLLSTREREREKKCWRPKWRHYAFDSSGDMIEWSFFLIPSSSFSSSLPLIEWTDDSGLKIESAENKKKKKEEKQLLLQS